MNKIEIPTFSDDEEKMCKEIKNRQQAGRGAQVFQKSSGKAVLIKI